MTLSTLDQSVPPSAKISPTRSMTNAVSLRMPPGTTVPFKSGTWPLTKTRSPNLVPPDRVADWEPRCWIESFSRLVAPPGVPKGEAEALKAKSEAMRGSPKRMAGECGWSWSNDKPMRWL